ncbi:right-handed parallel beta-helix repeat-containing protein [Hyunsoonleella ulvae]|uniref:hypothetical protein n=1 Tax=Hyunsoonleella ulvae TaxID=2799948 RepID=UPI00193A21BB|nr:hypothetical protein [Hyunsoonleella ulvae]
MKKTSNLIIYFFLATITCVSCNTEELYVEPEQVEEEVVDKTEEEPVEEEEPVQVDTSLPCDFDLSNIQPNSTVVINCILDLGGQTINLPENITFVYEGGDIVNGQLNFADGGNFDTVFMNSSLTIGGIAPAMKDPVFVFKPERWKIVEGRVSDEQAKTNTDLMEEYFLTVKNLGISTFKIDKLDAYFKVDGFLNQAVPELHAINIPSDFNLEMTSNTHLRMQPHGHFRAVLLGIYDEKNISVTGGVLHGDREEHNYGSGFVDSDGATGNTHEWVTVMAIKGGQNITIDNVTMMDPAGDCLSIASIYHYFDPRHIRSKNISINNTKFIRARRTNFVITSAEQVTIENSEFIDGGIDMPNSNGAAPSSNLNFEPVRGKDPATGEIIEYERVSHIYIRNNKQIVNDKAANPKAGDFQISHGNGPIIIEGNEMVNTGISFTTVDGLIIRNNEIINGEIAAGGSGNINRTDTVFGNEIYGNTVVTDKTAISIAGNGTTVRNNTFEGKIGASFGAGATNTSEGSSNTIFRDNVIKAENRGITSMNTLSNVLIENNEIMMLAGSTFGLVLTNSWDSVTEEANFIVRGNTITGTKSGTERGAPSSVIGANSITLENNNMGEIQINGGRDINVIDNKIEGSIGSNGVLFYADAPNTLFDSNEITIYPTKTPLNIDCVAMANGISLSSTTFENQQCIEK